MTVNLNLSTHAWVTRGSRKASPLELDLPLLTPALPRLDRVQVQPAVL